MLPGDCSSVGRCDMEAALSPVPATVCKELVDAAKQRRDPRRYIIYVLTDGEWLPESESEVAADGVGAAGAGGAENPLLMIIQQLWDNGLMRD